MDTTLQIAILSSAFTLLGVGVGAFFSYQISKKQIKAQVQSANHQQWVSELRDTIAEFQGVAFTMRNETNPAKFMRGFKRLSFLRSKCLLLINPKEEQSKKLKEIIDKICVVSLSDKDKPESTGALINSLIEVAQTILGAEWKKVIKG